MTHSRLPDILDEFAPQLLAGVEEAMSPTTVALPLRRTIERLPLLMRDLVERLRDGRLDEPMQWTELPIQFDVAPLVTALRLLKQSIYALIDAQQVPATPRDVRILGDWFAAVAESALAAENRRFADMLDTIPDHIMLHNADGALIYVNRATAEVARWAAGLAPEEVLGRRVIDFVRDRAFGRMVDDNIKRVLAGEIITEEFVLPHPDGGRWNEHHVLPLRGPDGTIEAIATASRDIHARKEAEEQLAHELTFRERMMGILGHDLRNPVSAVLGLASLMRNSELSDKARKQLDFIEQAARRMNEMIGTLLDFTRLRFRGALPITLARIDLDELARNVLAELRAAHRSREIELSSSGNLHGEWDPGRMAQLVTNLVVNALTHGERASPVRITVAGDADDVVVSVSNAGVPIAPALAERLFEPFNQSDDNDGRARPGLGLGLFIVREIVRAHGGTVGVHSGEGLVTFTATLPRSAAPNRVATS